ncbi:phage tail protein [Pseudomonas sp. NPDC087804]|uniref:phage tail protein n=1 Tax=Pseudomonas sp. NPDC087804 TaxID=3364449 RepID=UPI0037F6FD0B
MKKPDSLRAILRSAIPQLKRDPEKLHIFLDEGNIIATAANTLSFEYQYILNAIVTDFEGHPDTLIVPILDWLRVNQPEMMLNRDKMRDGFTFEAEILNTKTADISIKLRLTERIAVNDDPATGKRIIKHLDEPALDPYAEVEKWQLIIHGEVVQTT